MNRFPSKVIFGKEAREELLKGINIVANAVSEALGPKSRNVAINRSAGAPSVIHDGVKIAQSIDLIEEMQDMGAQLLKEAAIKTNDIAGDGTTTSIVLAHALINKGHEYIMSGTNPMTLKEELEEASKFAISELQKLSREVKDDSEIERVATISSADPFIGKLVSEAITKVGKDGVIDVEMGKGFETEVEYKQGMELDRGYKSPYFVTDQNTVEAVVDDPYILLTNKKINHGLELVPFLEKFIKVSKNLVIIGEIEEEALATLVVNKLKGHLNVVAVQPPAFGDRQIDELEDIAVLTGGTVVTVESGRKLNSVEVEELGRADKFKADRDKATILGGKGKPAVIKAYTSKLRNQLEMANTEFDGGIKKERLAKLLGGVAIIKVGAVTEVELADKKERVIDAVRSAQASAEEGIVAGGQIAYLTVSQVNNWPKTRGAELLRQSIKEPFRVLMENTGYDYAESLGKIMPINYPTAIDLRDGEVKDMIEAGVIEPLKVVRSALENAVSVAGMIYTTSVLVSEPYQTIDTK